MTLIAFELRFVAPVFAEFVNVGVALLAGAHGDLFGERLRRFDDPEEFLELWPRAVTALLEHVSDIVEEVRHFLLDELEVRVGTSPVLDLLPQLFDFILLLRSETLVFVPLFDEVPDDSSVLLKLPLAVLLVADQLKDPSLVLLRLA